MRKNLKCTDLLPSATNEIRFPVEVYNDVFVVSVVSIRYYCLHYVIVISGTSINALLLVSVLVLVLEALISCLVLDFAR